MEVFAPVRRFLKNQQLISMLIFIVSLILSVIYFGKMVTPFIAAIVVAYLLEGLIARIDKKVPRLLAVNIVFFGFSIFALCVLFVVVPLLLNQAKDFITSIPEYLDFGRNLILKLPEKYPEAINEERALFIISEAEREFNSYAKKALTGAVIKPLVAFISLIVYLILVPVMVFFLLKDKAKIIQWLSIYFPFDNALLKEVWIDVDGQIGNYIRGKFLEILIIWVISFIAFQLMGLNYALLLSLMVGVSVLIPYIGATVVTVPVLIVALVQFGIGSQFYLVAGVYLVIQIIDGNVLVPLIFSEAVNIHPVAIIVSILIFGGIWGFWGVFFAIPFATALKAVLNSFTDALRESKMDEAKVN